MEALEAPEILGQIEVLVSDKLQVVSYKWLSRYFSITSNQAKRLLQKFAGKYEDKVEVLYSLSGWLKNNPDKYSVKLSSGQKLEEVKMEFDGNCSVEVYSIQSCIPKDLAVLWNAEFVQTEELFDQPLAAENCLRNNRFGGISNPFVKRAVNGQLAASSTSQLKDNPGIVETKASNILKDGNFQHQPGKGGQVSTKEGMHSSCSVGSVSKAEQTVDDFTTKSVDDYATKPCSVKDSTNSLEAKRKGMPKEQISSGTGGSLATLWGRASVKLKPSCAALDSTSDNLNAAYTADAQICAEEVADIVSSGDEGYSVSFKRGPNGPRTRKRQFIMNYSDEDDENDNVASLASPISPTENPSLGSLQNAKNCNVENEIFSTDLNAETLLNKKYKIEDKKYGSSPVKCSTAQVSLENTKSNLQCELSNQQGKDSNPMTSKRKKVVNTRIDERGREVMEVVWEDPTCSKDADKDNNTIGGVNRHTTISNKEQPTGSNALANVAAKGGAKNPGKGRTKDAKQGNILSFFKKA